MQTRHNNAALSHGPPAARLGWLRRIAPALGVFLLAPLTAEYLTGYDTSTGNLRELLLGLIVLAPLYGGAALLIRETARRLSRGWPSMLLMALAFGIVQAGLVDHSLFNPSYRDIPYWESELRPTYIPALGISTNTTLNFLAGHMIWSIACRSRSLKASFHSAAPAPGWATSAWLWYACCICSAAGWS